MTSSVSHDVVVVGAGISGLTAAYRLLSHDPNLRVVVLEANDRVGGRTYSVELKSCNGGTDTWDLGGQWVGITQKNIINLLSELNLETYTQYTTGLKYIQYGSKDVIKTYTAEIPNLSWWSLIDIHLVIRKIDKMCKEIDPFDPYSHRNAALWDSMSVEAYKQQTMRTDAGKEAFQCGMRSVLGIETSQVSLLHLLLVARTAGGLEQLTGSRGGAQGQKIKGGAQMVSNVLREKIGAENVLLNHAVTSITQSGDRVVVKTHDAEFSAHRVIMSVPPNQLGRIEFAPALPSITEDLMKRMPIGQLDKIIITYEKAFWRTAGKSGEVVTTGGPYRLPGCDTGPMSAVFDGVTHNGSPALVGLRGGKPAVQWKDKSEEERKKAVLDTLAQFFGAHIYDYIDYEEKDWTMEPYIQGSPVNSAQTGAMSSFSKAIREPHGCIHFAGTATATEWIGYFDGAVQSGTRAAKEVLYNIRPELLALDDLTDTAYARPVVHDPRLHRHRGRHLVRLTILLSMVAGAAWTYKKYIR